MIFEWLIIKCRSGLRKLCFPGRRDSFPFISGDAYRIRCDVDLTSVPFDVLKKFDKGRFHTVFLPVGRYVPFLHWLLGQDSKFLSWNLLIHNGDFNPNPIELEKISYYFNRVYAVNWMGPSKVAKALPIGLENRTLRRNGIPWEYHYLRRRYFSEAKHHLLLISFKESNNLRERGSIYRTFYGKPEVILLNKFLPPFAYKKLLSQSKFVISPPGNGVDCHRTWEAFYLNSVPIVLSRAWPFAEADLPVLIIDEWDDLEGKNISKNNYVRLTPLEIWNRFMLEPFQEELET